MAEGIFKKLLGRKIFVQSAGIYNNLEINGFSIKVCREINIELKRHQVKSLVELEQRGGFVGAFDLAVALTSRSFEKIQEYSKFSSLDIEFWEIDEPLISDKGLEETLTSYRKTRDIIFKKVAHRFKKFIN